MASYVISDIHGELDLFEELLDRIDLCVETQEIRYKELSQENHNESSEDIRKRVCY